MTVADPIEALAAFLKADAGVASIVGTRVFGGELPRAEISSMPRQAVVLLPAGGGAQGLGFQEWGDQRVDVDCYGATPRDGWLLYLAVNAALKQLSHDEFSSVMLMSATPSGRGIPARDPETDWPVTLSSWTLLAHEIEVS
jgi:hypothetical protein